MPLVAANDSAVHKISCGRSVRRRDGQSGIDNTAKMRTTTTKGCVLVDETFHDPLIVMTRIFSLLKQPVPVQIPVNYSHFRSTVDEVDKRQIFIILWGENTFKTPANTKRHSTTNLQTARKIPTLLANNLSILEIAR